MVSTNKGDDVPVAKKAIGEIQPKDMEDLPVAKEATREPSWLNMNSESKLELTYFTLSNPITTFLDVNSALWSKPTRQFNKVNAVS